MTRPDRAASLYSLILVAALAAPAIASAVPAADQDPRGGVTGRVTDPSGAAVANADVRATNAETGVAASNKTNNTGVFSIPFLLPGTYVVTVELPGFRKFVRENIQVRVSE